MKAWLLGARPSEIGPNCLPTFLSTCLLADEPVYLTLPAQSAWPQRQAISILVPMPSLCGLQYFALFGGTQLHAAFAHCFWLAILTPSTMPPPAGHEKFDGRNQGGAPAVAAGAGAQACHKTDIACLRQRRVSQSFAWLSLVSCRFLARCLNCDK